MKMRKPSIILLAIIAYLLIGATAVAFGLDGEVIVSGKCTACHGSDRITGTRKTAGEWAILTDKEINRGAQLNAAERTAVINYLSANFSSGSQPVQAAVTTPTVQTTPQKQAYTGLEMWQLVLAGSSFIGSGVYIRRRKIRK